MRDGRAHRLSRESRRDGAEIAKGAKDGHARDRVGRSIRATRGAQTGVSVPHVMRRLAPTVLRFRGGGGLCYNRGAVRDAGELGMFPGDFAGSGFAPRASAGSPARAEERPPSLAAQDEQEAAATRGADVGPAVAGTQEDASRYCPVCSRRLESSRCKLVCRGCGYYMSCADYY